MTAADEGCTLYVDGDDSRVRADLCRLLGIESQHRTLTLTDVEVWVGRNDSSLGDAPDADFPDWPTRIEVYPALADRPPGSGSASSPDGALVSTVAGLMDELRRRGNRVVAACDFEEQLPRWDHLRPNRVDGEDLDDTYDTGDDRHWYRGELFTGTVVDRQENGVRHETEVRLGVRDGLARTYRADGSLWREDWYDAGTRVRKRRWHGNGQVQLDARANRDGQLEVQRWTDDGRPGRRGLLDRLLRRAEIDSEPGWK